MKLVFFGTPDYVIPVLEFLHKKFKSKTERSPIEAVVTQAPKPQGRKKELSFSPVDTWAYRKGIAKFFNPTDLIKNKINADLGILASYGEIIPFEVINHFPHGILNIHPSLLPLWRGSSPVQAMIISKDQAGVTILKVDDKLDHGPIICQFKDEVLPEDTTDTLRNRLFKRSGEILATLIPAYIAGKITPRKQDESSATYTREIKKDDAFIPAKFIKAASQGRTSKSIWKMNFMKDFTSHYSPITIHNFIRAMQPWPVAWTNIRIKNQDLRIKILKSHLEPITNHKPQTTNQKLVFDSVQLEGKSPVSWKQFKEGYNTRF
ncbi:hypothetical protein A2Z67_06380 [Candidatus Woesebacteria bacterium RBG_13_36_22]|uniref:methionyl-tRNA formyltransferase n=1 Tax=Candidatus Woesebacteria bacterium RBG_13_36_22 TaxID=1802478 RepID=A0A1F7X1P3_9BACT|nr:MAG: hypothetical protein A2Z67_06380 [Candidatus Woesebacteria bacterium RBG_13_36_22]